MAIEEAALKTYRRQILLACLHRADSDLTAGDLLDRMSDLAFGLGHDKEVLAGLSGPVVSGLLRGLKGEGQVTTPSTRYNPTRGRDEPTWAPVGARLPEYPLPTQPRPAGAEDAPSPVAVISRDEVLSFLENIAVAERTVANMAAELVTLRSWGMRLLAAAGAA